MSKGGRRRRGGQGRAGAIGRQLVPCRSCCSCVLVCVCICTSVCIPLVSQDSEGRPEVHMAVVVGGWLVVVGGARVFLLPPVGWWVVVCEVGRLFFCSILRRLAVSLHGLMMTKLFLASCFFPTNLCVCVCVDVDGRRWVLWVYFTCVDVNFGPLPLFFTALLPPLLLLPLRRSVLF